MWHGANLQKSNFVSQRWDSLNRGDCQKWHGIKWYRVSNKTQDIPPPSSSVLCSCWSKTGLWNTEIRSPFKPHVLCWGYWALHLKLTCEYSSACPGSGWKWSQELPGVLVRSAPVPIRNTVLCCLLKEKRGTPRFIVMLLVNKVQGWERAMRMRWLREIARAAVVTSKANWERACRSTKMLMLDRDFLQTAEELFTCSDNCLWPILILRVCLPCSLLWSLLFWVKTQRCY